MRGQFGLELLREVDILPWFWFTSLSSQ